MIKTNNNNERNTKSNLSKSSPHLPPKKSLKLFSQEAQYRCLFCLLALLADSGPSLGSPRWRQLCSPTYKPSPSHHLCHQNHLSIHKSYLHSSPTSILDPAPPSTPKLPLRWPSILERGGFLIHPRPSGSCPPSILPPKLVLTTWVLFLGFQPLLGIQPTCGVNISQEVTPRGI